MSKKERYSLRYIIWTLCLSITGTTFGVYLFLYYPSGKAVGFGAVPSYYDDALLEKITAFNDVAYQSQHSVIKAFSLSPTLPIWFLIMIIGFTLTPMLVFEAIEAFRKIHRVFHYPTRVLWTMIPLVVLTVLAMAILPRMVANEHHISLAPPIRYFYPKLYIYIVITGVASALAIVVLLISGNIAYNLRKRLANDDSISLYYLLHQTQMRFLFLLGLLVSTGILATSFMRQIHIELYGKEQIFLPEQSVAVEGIFYTFLLAIFFIPARRELHRFGHRIIDREFGLRPPEGTSWQTWMAEREAMETSLGLKTDWKERLKWAIPVLAPLVSSILPEQLLG